MNGTNQRTVGVKGEEMAANYLEESGYILVEQNFCIPGGEIDLIMKDGDVWVFVEVKLRKQGNFGTPEESITPQKLKFLERSVEKYFAKQNLSVYETDFRMDLVAIEQSISGKDVVRHYKNAFVFDDFF